MDLSMKWLSDYVDIGEMPLRGFADAMTMSGSKVEGYSVEGSDIANVVVGKVLSVEKHPNADSLVICQVEVGGERPLQIVTGATNVVAGALVPVAKDNSLLPGGKKIRKGKLRGEVSEGMLCSLGELGLTVHDFPYAIEDGIFLLEEPCQPGQDIQSALGLNDAKVEFEITPNRPDCLSVLGLAREAAVTFHRPLRLPQPVIQRESGDIHSLLSVRVQNTDLCQRYVARMIQNVKIAPSPRWMRERLRASGVRPINNIVDITNYVMLEYGQPMHAFDHQYVKGGQIVVRNAQPGEAITTLDGVQRALSPDMLVICDAEKPSAVAGVMGGEYSGINDDTRTVVFESACFLGSSVRTTSRKLGLRTDSSSRFEKGLDPATCMPAVLRACQLVEELGAGEVVGGVIDQDYSDKTLLRVPFDPAWINRFLGIEASEEAMRRILTDLSFTFEGDEVIAPSFRADVETKADIAEEVARFYGYDKIPVTTIRGTAKGAVTPRQRFEREINRLLLGQGLSEALTYSFISPKYYDKIALPAESPLRRSVVIQNPLGEDTSVMRTTALPSMLEVLARNYNGRNPEAALYEIATEYRPTGPDTLPEEKQAVVIGLYGPQADFYALKGVVEVLLERLNIAGAAFAACTDDPTFHPGRCALLTLGDSPAGVLGEAHPSVLENYGISTQVYLARLEVDALYANVAPERQYQPLPKFPASTRDLALLCDAELPVAQLEAAIRGAVGKILERVQLFDVYRGSQITADKKSVAYTITMRAADRTLTDAECDDAVARVLRAMEKLGVSLRA